MADTAEALRLVTRDTALRNAVIDAALDCIVMMDQEGYIIEFNPAAEKTFGYSRDEAVGQYLADLLIPENLQKAHRDGLALYLSTGEHQVLNKRVEVPARNKAGDDLLVELAISPVVFDGVTFFSAYLRDITEARAAQEQLRASEERFQSLFELCPDAILIFDAEGVVVDVNSRACELIARKKEDVMGHPAREFIPRKYLPPMVAKTQAAAIGEFFQIQVEVLHSEGRGIPTEIVGRRLDSASGPLTHMVVRDISLRLENEKELREAKEHAELASAAKSDFLANMSHEMRTPLNGIIGSLSLVDQSDVKLSASNFIRSAEQSAETLLTLIDDLLDLSRIEAGETDVEYIAFAPGALETMVFELFGPLANQKGLELNVNFTNASAPVYGDVGKIRQVLVNLVGNALKFTQRGQINVEMDYVNKGDIGELKFEVSDTGIGIAKSDQPLLFERFKQADSSRSKQHAGTGLGLSICKELTEIMNGSISVSSAPGVGSTFSFTVPVASSVKQDEIAENKGKKDVALKGRVLIAEDSETNARVATAMLDRLGLQYEHVMDGAAAVDAAMRSDFDLILMDVSMPIMDGLQATSTLRSRGYDRPIIGLTAHAFKADRDQALELGMSGYVTKPLRIQSLKQSLKEWLLSEEVESVVQSDPAFPLDREAIKESWEDDMEVFAEISRIFIKELGWRIPLLGNMDDHEEIERQAHSLKGGALNVGAVELSRLANELNIIATTGPQTRVQELIDLIKPETQRVKSALEQEYLGGQSVE